jgi:hypothetical protein
MSIPKSLNCYPKLQVEIAKLRATGVIVEDLTGMFKSLDESVWDDSPHVNQKRRWLIADKVVQSIRANKELIARNRPTQHPSATLQAAGKLSH